MTSPPRQLHLNVYLTGSGQHEAAWRLPQSNPFANLDPAHWRHLAQVTERARIDSLFLADGPVLFNPKHRPTGAPEPTILLTVMAMATTHLGLIATASTTYNDPYNLARRFATLDHVSGGRIGWNIVTTAERSSAHNFGLDKPPPHRDRYLRAAEFVDVSIRLWDSWEDDAEIADKATGMYADPSRIHQVDHEGPYFKIRGPLNIPRSPQGRPLLVQAGSSEDGREFAARYAEAIFTVQQTLADGQRFYADLKGRIRRLGRDPDLVTILPGLLPIVGSTETEARALASELEELIIPDNGLGQLAKVLEVPPEILELDKPLPAEVFSRPRVEGNQSRFDVITALAQREKLTVRRLIGRLAGGRGHLSVTGTPEQVADTIVDWFTHGAADGFNVMPAVLPSGLETFAEQVVPVLQRRGLFRTEYTGRTLREHYGLPRPASQYAQPVRPAEPVRRSASRVPE